MLFRSGPAEIYHALSGVDALAEVMRQVKRELPDEEGITVRSADGVLYDHLIKTIDVLRSERFSAVHVTDAGSSG